MEKMRKIPVVLAENPADREAAELLSEHLRTEMVRRLTDVPEGTLVLKFCPEGLTLTDGKLSLRGDFSGMARRLKANNLRQEMLVRAARIRRPERRPVAVDATAGLGEDSLLLAAAGFTVELYEYNPVIAALLADALKRARGDGNTVLASAAAEMHLHEEDSAAVLRKGSLHPELVLLDPMFPERKKSALIGKKFQLLQQLERPCSEEEELLQAAEAAHPWKIVIKRPLKGPFLAGRKPEYSISGKAVRYDCFVFPEYSS